MSIQAPEPSSGTRRTSQRDWRSLPFDPDEAVRTTAEGPSSLTIMQSRDGDVAVVRLDGELDMLGCPAVQRALEAAAPLSDEIVLDLRGLEFIDSTGLRCVYEHDRERRLLYGGSLVCLVSAGGPVRRVIDLVGLSDELDVREG